MALTLFDIGADAILKRYFNSTTPAGGNNLTIRLFTNNLTPLDTHTAASFTEAAGGGYSAITVTNGSWVVTVGNDPSDATYAQQTWTFTGALTTNPTIYGYTVEDADGVAIWGELFGTPFTPANNGDTLDIDPKFEASKGTPA